MLTLRVLAPETQIEENLWTMVREWIDSYILFGHQIPPRKLHDSYLNNQAFWQIFPEFFWAAFQKVGVRGGMPRNMALAMWQSMASITSLFVTMDNITLARVSKQVGSDNCRYPELASSPYLTALHVQSGRGDARIAGYESQGVWPNNDRATELAYKFSSMPGGSLDALDKLAKGHIDVMGRFPRLIDNMGAGCQLVADILCAILRKYRYGELSDGQTLVAKQHFSRGLGYYKMVSSALERALSKSINHVSSETATAFILGLTDIYQTCLYNDDVEARAVLDAYHEKHPNLPTQLLADAVSWEWRLDVLGRIIRSSQMQLRVWAVGQMCTDLVAFWKRCGEPPNPHEDLHPFLAHFAQYLHRTKLVEYILGPTCHPEITCESGNVVGFLLVTRYYQKEQTDLLWQTITTSQDRRVTDALTRTTANIINLYDYDNLVYLAEKLQTLPIEMLNQSAMRALIENCFKGLMSKIQNERRVPDMMPYYLCLKLLQDSSVQTPQVKGKYEVLHNFAVQKLRELHHLGIDRDHRRQFYLACLQDLSSKSSTTLGSLYALFISIRNTPSPELRVLVTEHDFTRLVVEELEHAIETGRSGNAAGAAMLVLDGPSNVPRREFINSIVCNEPGTLTAELGQRLWDLMVGPRALSHDDRVAAWNKLNEVAGNTDYQNPFISTCFADYLPKLPPECFCAGALYFVKHGVLPRVNTGEIALERDESLRASGIEQLWRMILTSSDDQVASTAIMTLVKDIYVDSTAILDYPHHTARQVHLALVNRCLQQLESAKVKLESFSDGTTSGDDEPMVIVASESQVVEQDRIFIRSLAVLQSFLEAHQSKSHFATADLRSLMPPSPPATVEGESADLKYQSFDGDTQTEVQPLVIGKRNTAASLLATISATTGFENYRIYYRGKAFLPDEKEICRSLEDLQIQNGLILVKREETLPSSSAWIRPGTSPLEIEILGHFQELWRYLSMEERFAREIYQFLTKLPADPQALESFDSESTSYMQVFPIGQPFKCLYAIYALAEYIDAYRRRMTTWPDRDDTEATYLATIKKALGLIFSAISDPQIIDSCPSDHVKMQLSLSLMNALVDFLRAWRMSTSEKWSEMVVPLARLASILRAAKSVEDENSCPLISSTFTAILQLSSIKDGIWEELKKIGDFGSLVQELLMDRRSDVRTRVAKTLDTCLEDERKDVQLAEFLWPLIINMMPHTLSHRDRCHEVFNLAERLILRLRAAVSEVLDLVELASQCCEHLLTIETTEEITDADPNDVVVGGLVKILNCCLEMDPDILDPAREAFREGEGSKLFWKYLFQRLDEDGYHIPQKLLFNRDTRWRLYDIVYKLSTSDGTFGDLLSELLPLTQYDEDEEAAAADPYLYDLPPQFERAKAIRSACGYVGLRNLSNTCYLNSLFTQLFMNVDFRCFILNAIVQDPGMQRLLFQTQKLFASMQESVKRYVDPQQVVGAIKTYDDAFIDIHNQMDVDEFYNLLFDRWESQLLTADEKKSLRSFYGGQLVQQVKSNECEHVSERLEPFSAIQCDIKGKHNLQESLQAYVDGEIMEGDNKYKCSTCDKHVDAVKRACLKDVPDNLIFHLKRFDFNLRTMQRSKINDHFSFPEKIDMRPYTVDHLTAPDEPGAEDMFELVGILIHSGTAESGHYYSYIRERPAASEDASFADQTWVEFNDETVTSWDQTTYDHAAYGGQEQRYDASGYYDKSYSAYMLFYQRSSSLHRSMESYSVPVKVEVPGPFVDYIGKENVLLAQRHVLFDPGHAPFIQRMFSHAVRLNDITAECPGTKIERRAMSVMLGHLDQVVTRTKDLPDFHKYYETIHRALARCPQCSAAFIRYFVPRTEAFRALVQRSPEQPVRYNVGVLLILALSRLKKEGWYNYQPRLLEDYTISREIKSVLHTIAPLFQTLWSNFHSSIRSWGDVFGLVLRFAQLGDVETAMLLGNDILASCLRIIQADTQLPDLPPNLHRMLNNIGRRAPNRPPSYDAIIALIDHLIAKLGPVDGGNITDRPIDRLKRYLLAEGNNTRALLPWTKDELTLITMEWPSAGGHGSSMFIQKLLDLSQNYAATNNIIRRLTQISSLVDDKVYRTLLNTIYGMPMQNHTSAPFLRAATVYRWHTKDTQRKRDLYTYIVGQARQLTNSDGRYFMSYFRDTYDNPVADDDGDMFELQMTLMHRWAPTLLGNYEYEVRYGAEEFLQKHIFNSGVNPAFTDEDGGERRATLVLQVARELGFACLLHLRDHYVNRRTQVARDTILSLQHVIAKSAAYFNPEPEEEGADREFLRLSTRKSKSLRRITTPVVTNHAVMYRGPGQHKENYRG